MAARALPPSTAAAWAPSGSEAGRHLGPISSTAGFAKTDLRSLLIVARPYHDGLVTT